MNFNSQSFKEESFSEELLSYKHYYSKNNDLHFRKWSFYKAVKEEDTFYILSNEYGNIKFISRQLDDRKTRLSCIKNQYQNKWYLRIIKNYKTISYDVIDTKDISEYLNDIKESNVIVLKNSELTDRLSSIIGDMSDCFENTFEVGWILENAYKITIKKYEENGMYIENKETHRKVKISESRLIQFIEKNKDIFKEIKKSNEQKIQIKINEKLEMQMQERQRQLDEINKKLGELILTSTRDYNTMSVDDRVSIHKRIQSQHSELFIKKSIKRKYEIQSCKLALPF